MSKTKEDAKEVPKQDAADAPKTQWNPMARFGDYLLTRHADAPRVLWIILQLGGLVTLFVAVRFMVALTNVLAYPLELMLYFVGMTVPALQNVFTFFFFVGTQGGAHVLWKEMNRERETRMLDLYVRTGKNASCFKNDPDALSLRAAFLRNTPAARGRRKGRRR